MRQYTHTYKGGTHSFKVTMSTANDDAKIIDLIQKCAEDALKEEGSPPAQFQSLEFFPPRTTEVCTADGRYRNTYVFEANLSQCSLRRYNALLVSRETSDNSPA